MAKIWYFAEGKNSKGPYDKEEILKFYNSGRITDTTYLFAKGITPNWTYFKDIQEFKNPVVSDTPPLPSMQEADEIDYTIYGDDLQFVEIELDPGESVISEAGAMMYMTDHIQAETVFTDQSKKSSGNNLLGNILHAGKRLLMGESLFFNKFTYNGPPSTKGKVAFAAPYPGKIIPINLKDVGGVIHCQKESFLCAARGISIDIAFNKKLGVGLFGGEGFIMEKLEGDGYVFVHAGGTIVEKTLKAGETLRVDTGCVVAFQPTVDFDVQLQNDFKTALFGGEGLFLAVLKGPGKVYLQSLPFSRLADKIYSAAPQTGGKTTGEGSEIFSNITSFLDG